MKKKRREVHTPCKVHGHVTAVIEYLSGDKTVIEFPNTILRTGRNALAAALANDVGDSFNFYVSRMLFGDGGTAGGATKFVDTARNGLFGITRANKPVIAQVDPNIPSQVIFTSVVAYTEANGYALNEMALQMNTGDLYSMVTFPDLTKTDQMQITWNWRLSFV
jgi:hypothetical protein